MRGCGHPFTPHPRHTPTHPPTHLPVSVPTVCVCVGAVVYLNGVEVLRSNMPAGAVTAATPALSDRTSETAVHGASIPIAAFVVGVNTVAVEVHQATPSRDDDLVFHLTLQMIEIPTATATATSTASASPSPTRSPSPTASTSQSSTPTAAPLPMDATYDGVPAGSVWRFLDNGSDQGTAWREPGFDAASWATGAAQVRRGWREDRAGC